MAELEKDHACDNCGSKYRLMYDEDQVSYTPDNCPFCGDLVEGYGDLEVEETSFDEDVELDDSWSE